MFGNVSEFIMKITKPYTASLTFNGKFYNILVKETAFLNGYKIVWLIVNSRHIWLINDFTSLKSISDDRLDEGLKSKIVKCISRQNILTIAYKAKSITAKSEK